MFAPLSCELTALETWHLVWKCHQLVLYFDAQVKRYFIVQVLSNPMAFLYFFSLSFACNVSVNSFMSKFKTLFPDETGQITTHLLGIYLSKISEAYT